MELIKQNPDLVAALAIKAFENIQNYQPTPFKIRDAVLSGCQSKRQPINETETESKKKSTKCRIPFP